MSKDHSSVHWMTSNYFPQEKVVVAVTVNATRSTHLILTKCNAMLENHIFSHILSKTYFSGIQPKLLPRDWQDVYILDI